MVAHVNPGAPLPEEPGKRWWKIIAPKGTTPLMVMFLSDSFEGYWTHWIPSGQGHNGFTLPCTRTFQCPYCKPEEPHGSRWTGYAPVWSQNDRDTKILAIAEGMARQLLPIITRRGTLRGVVVELRRKPGKVNNPVTVAVKEERDPKKVMPAFDIYDSLSRLWGINVDLMKEAEHGRDRMKKRLDDDDDQGVQIPA